MLDGSATSSFISVSNFPLRGSFLFDLQYGRDLQLYKIHVKLP